MTPVLVDSNVILDVATQDPVWAERSGLLLAREAETAQLVINPIIFAEVSVGFEGIEELDAALPPGLFRREHLPWEAAFLAGKCFLAYRRRGGKKTPTLPDFYIGAHAALAGYRLLTRDVARYQTYFPGLEILVP
jgi:predicted nucleic acid-binding protein